MCLILGNKVSKQLEPLKLCRIEGKAEKGDLASQQLLNEIYGGQKFTRVRQVFKWYREGALKGCCYAHYKIGMMYFNGAGVSRDGVIALKWLAKSAGKGFRDACFVLQAIGRDNEYFAVLRECFLQGAGRGGGDAEYALGIMYDYGVGKARDAVTACRYYLIAREDGSLEADDALNSLMMEMERERAGFTEPFPPKDFN